MFLKGLLTLAAYSLAFTPATREIFFNCLKEIRKELSATQLTSKTHGVKWIWDSKGSPQQGLRHPLLCSQCTHSLAAPPFSVTHHHDSAAPYPHSCLSWTCWSGFWVQFSSVSTHQDTSPLWGPSPWASLSHAHGTHMDPSAQPAGKHQAWLTTALVRRQKGAQVTRRYFTSHFGVPILLPNALRAHLLPSNIKSSSFVSCWWQPKVSCKSPSLCLTSNWRAGYSQCLGTRQKLLPQCQCNYTCMKWELEELRVEWFYSREQLSAAFPHRDVLHRKFSSRHRGWKRNFCLPA